MTLAAAVAGCAGIPDAGSVRVGRQLAAGGGLADVDVRVLPAAPLPGEAPVDLVRGFLRAMVDADGSYETARTYLSTRAAASWHADTSITTYDDDAVRVSVGRAVGSTRVVRFSAPRVGRIDGRGDFTPVAGTVRATFTLVRTGAGWRVDRLPSGALLSLTDATRSFRFASVYYLDPAGTTLVPEQVLLRPQAQGVSTALVRALLSGPGPWLAPAVRTAFPRGTELQGNVAVEPSGVAEVDLTGAVRQATPTQLRQLSAQLVWTLRQVSEVSGVRLFADGASLPIPDAAVDQPRTAWATFNPDAPPALRPAFYDTPAGWRTHGGSIPGLGSFDSVSGLAVSQDGSRYAGVRHRRRGDTLVVGRAGARPVPRARADAFTDPTFGPDGAVFSVEERGLHRRLLMVTAQGGVRAVRVSGGLLARPVQDLRFSRDGARVAAVVGAAGHGRLLVGRYAIVRGRSVVGAFRAVLPGVPDVRGVAWDGADQVVVTTADVSGGRELRSVDSTGYSSRTVSTAGLRARPVDVAAAPGEPLLVTGGGTVWLDDPAAGWVPLEPGSEPGYAD